ncbi:MAG: YukJ family protein [Polyangiaceae bacterium]|nr:YukJ family protein [Polyangiaceae bacterium]
MALKYGFVKTTVRGGIRIQGSRQSNGETQYHLHANLSVPVSGHVQTWDTAVNVGTDDADDLLRYRIALDYQHPITATLAAAAPGPRVLTGERALPALDFLRSDVLADTGPWRDSDVMDGSPDRDPYRSLARLLAQAQESRLPVYVFGRFYTEGFGLHDVHMNQGSAGRFWHYNGNDHQDHNDVWQDGALLVDLGDDGWAGYFTAFTQQKVPTDELGNPERHAHEITDDDPGSQAQASALPREPALS